MCRTIVFLDSIWKLSVHHSRSGWLSEMVYFHGFASGTEIFSWVPGTLTQLSQSCPSFFTCLLESCIKQQVEKETIMTSVKVTLHYILLESLQLVGMWTVCICWDIKVVVDAVLLVFGQKRMKGKGHKKANSSKETMKDYVREYVEIFSVNKKLNKFIILVNELLSNCIFVSI